MKDVDFDRLGESFGNKKLKNDAYRAEDYYSPKERGGCLTAFLVFALLGNVLILGLFLMTYSSVRGQLDGGSSLLLYGIFAVQVGIFISVIGLWNWKRWGYYGMMAGYAIGIVMNLLTGSLSTIAGSVIGLALLNYLMKDKMDYLE